QHEQMLKNSVESEEGSGAGAGVAYAARAGNGGGKGKGRKASMACHKCGELGHFERECKKGAQGPQGSKESGKPKFRKGRECYGCGSTDHILKDCPKGGGSGSNRGAASWRETE
ncbi:hypothetical protein KFL_012990010, partial [Klebsormidium nitens]